MWNGYGVWSNLASSGEHPPLLHMATLNAVCTQHCQTTLPEFSCTFRPHTAVLEASTTVGDNRAVNKNIIFLVFTALCDSYRSACLRPRPSCSCSCTFNRQTSSWSIMLMVVVWVNLWHYKINKSIRDTINVLCYAEWHGVFIAPSWAALQYLLNVLLYRVCSVI